MKTTVLAAAFWISAPLAGSPRNPVPVPYLRRAFSLAAPVSSARLTVTALGLYEVEINGKVVGDHIFAPGWTDYRKRVAYQVYDVTKFLHEGENVLGAILGDGWYCGALGWEIKRQFYGDRPALRARLDITLRDGSSVVVATDEKWHTAFGPILESDFLGGETYDARWELGDWSQAGYNAKAWGPVQVVTPAPMELVVSEAPPVRRLGEFRPKESKGAVELNKTNRNHVFDLGQNFSGRVRLKVRAERGTTVTLRFAEILNPNGTVYTENLRGARATDRYTCKGSETETWEPRFTFHGFRYVEVSAIPLEASVELVGVVLHSDIKPTGHFACSNPLLNQLQKNIVWGQKGNFLEVPTDCPQRDERLGWTGDAQVFVRTAAFNMDVQGFFRKWMQDMRDAQSPAGGIPPVIPKVMLDMEDGGPAWADAAIICPWTIYLCYGDRKILEDHYDSMVRYHRFLTEKRTKDFIRSHPEVDSWGGFGDWLALDGGGKTEGMTPRDLIGTAFYAYDTALLAKIATLLGREKDAAHYRKLHPKIVSAFQRRFVTSGGSLISGTQTSMVLALRFDLLPEKLRLVVAGVLAKDVETRGFHLATGFVGTPYILGVLEANGHLDTAYKLLEQETFPSWLFPVKNGATTIWERWDGWTPEKGPQDKGMNSYNHYAYGAVGEWMVSAVAGLDLDPAQPGYRHIIFKPRPGGTLTWAEAELSSPNGKIRIHWKRTKKGLDLDLTVPPGSRATLIPPPGYGKRRSLKPGRTKLKLAAKSS